MKRIILIFAVIAATLLHAQNYNTELNTLGQYVQRMYMNEPFEGARIIEDIDNCYLICVVTEVPSANEYATNRKAEVKGLSMANEFLNGAHISQNTVMYTKETSNGYSYSEIEDFIDSRSMGYVQTMQIISVFTNHQKKKVYVFCKQLPMPVKSQGKKIKRKE